MRVVAILAVALLDSTNSAGVEHAPAATQHYQLNIPRQNLDTALKDLAQQTGLQIGRFSEKSDGSAVVGPVLGDETLAQALKTLLDNTGLEYKIVSDTVIAVYNPKEAIGAQFNSPPSGGEGAEGSGDRKEVGKKSSQDFRMAPVDQGESSIPSAVGEQVSQGNSRSPSTALEEITVTAQKRAENLMDVPMSLTAVSGEQLERTQSYRFEDYVATVPGLTFVRGDGLASQLVIRGITESGDAPLNSGVATYIDETPLTPEGPFAGVVASAQNVDTFDMQRIEVLKGPQGTLYGANALAGLLKFVTNAPDPSGFAAKVEIGGSSVSSGGVGFDYHSMVNIPLSSDAAIRLVGYDNYYPGFINDPAREVTDVNSARYDGGRASLLYQPSEDFSIRFNALYQRRSSENWSNEDVNPGSLTPIHGNLTQEYLIDQPAYAITELYNITIDWDVGFAKLLSTTSYSALHPNDRPDVSTLYGPIVSSILGASYGLAQSFDAASHAVTQEMRLASSGNERLQWQLGGFYTNEHALNDGSLSPIDATNRSVLYDFPTNFGTYWEPTTYHEFAAFANLDYRITPTFDVAVGGRYSENRQTYYQVFSGIFFGTSSFGTPSSQGVSTFSADARWHIMPETMLYARIASGYVPGGPNDTFPGSDLPRTYSSSKTVNYETGIKSRLLDGRVSFEVSAFDIDWRNIQLTATIDGVNTATNGGTAQSRGVEWNVAYLPISGLTLDLNGAYTDAYLTQATPASVGGLVGDRLPAVPLWQGSASVEYRRALPGSNCSAVGGVSWRFSGSRYAEFEPSSPRQEMPSFSLVDLRAGVDINRWSILLYVKNVTNRIAINYLEDETLQGGAGPQSAAVYPPRTVGASVTAQF